MAEAMLRVPLSEAEAFKARLAKAEARVADLEAQLARLNPPCGCGCQEDGEHWSVAASVGDSRGGTHSGFSTVARALAFVVEESAGARFTDGRHPWDPRTMHMKVDDTPIGVDAAGNFFALVGDFAPPAKKARAKKTKPVDTEHDEEAEAA